MEEMIDRRAAGTAPAAKTAHAGRGEQSPDAAELIAAHLARVGYDDLPADVVAASKAAILDTLGCLLAGTATQEIDAIVSLVAERGGRASSTVIGRQLKVPAEAAVLANAAAIHQYDFDDTHDIAVCHPTSASLIPALALAEQRGNVSGRALLTAVALSNDITSRVALAIEGRLTDYPWFRAPVVGLFGATAAASKILGATEEQHLEALGLTLPMIGGTLSSLQHGGSSVRAIRDGMAYRNGVLAAELALRGVRGDRQVFDGPYGFYHAFFRGEYRRDTLVGGLGESYETTRVSLKPWPAIRHLHRVLSCVTDLMSEHGLRFDDIAEVLVHVGQINLDRCRPVALGAIPQQRMDLLSNLPFAVGAVIRHGGIPLAIYRDGALADAVIRTAMPKVRWTYDERMNGTWTFEPAAVRIRTTDGRELCKERKISKGHPDDPMTTGEREAKFRDCASAASQPLTETRMTEVIAMVARLDELDDVSGLTRLLA
jgi:2-methylcitrate dehydratase PrpD